MALIYQCYVGIGNCLFVFSIVRLSSSARLCQQSGGGVRDDHRLVQFISYGTGGDVVGISGGSDESLCGFTRTDLVASASGKSLIRPIWIFRRRVYSFFVTVHAVTSPLRKEGDISLCNTTLQFLVFFACFSCSTLLTF